MKSQRAMAAQRLDKFVKSPTLLLQLGVDQRISVAMDIEVVSRPPRLEWGLVWCCAVVVFIWAAGAGAAVGLWIVHQ